MAEKVRIGFVGAGYMGQNAHMANYAKIDSCELAALAEGRAETAKAVAQKFGIPKIYPDHHALLEDESIDGVVAVMGFHLFNSLARDILNAGKPLITEKPICIRPDNARELNALAEEKGVHYQIGYMKRHDVGAKAARQTIQQWRETGEAGNLSYLRVCMPPGDWTMEHEPPIHRGDHTPAYAGQTGESPPEWMDEHQGNRYVGFINFYIHQINLIRYLLGEDYRVEYADSGGRVMTAVSDSGALILLEMAERGLQYRWIETYTAHFDSGYVHLEMPAPMARHRAGEATIYRAGDPPQETRLYLPQKWAFEEQARAFAASIQHGAPNLAPAADAVKDLEVSEEYIRAAS